MAITAQMVKELREKTGAGMMDCKKALTETNGDMEQAIDFLREKGIAKGVKKNPQALQIPSSRPVNRRSGAQCRFLNSRCCQVLMFRHGNTKETGPRSS